MEAAMDYLRRERCPYCAKGRDCKRGYKVRRTYDGWRCHGYRSKAWDERKWTA